MRNAYNIIPSSVLYVKNYAPQLFLLFHQRLQLFTLYVPSLQQTSQTIL